MTVFELMQKTPTKPAAKARRFCAECLWLETHRDDPEVKESRRVRAVLKSLPPQQTLDQVLARTRDKGAAPMPEAEQEALALFQPPTRPSACKHPDGATVPKCPSRGTRLLPDASELDEILSRDAHRARAAELQVKCEQLLKESEELGVKIRGALDAVDDVARWIRTKSDK